MKAQGKLDKTIAFVLILLTVLNENHKTNSANRHQAQQIRRQQTRRR